MKLLKIVSNISNFQYVYYVIELLLQFIDISNFNFESNIGHVTSESCNPSPCGLNSQCRIVNGHVVCSCLPNYIGSSPNCRPECVVSSECALNKACINQKCVDPCTNACGQNTRCQVVNHRAVCSCLVGYTGDPFVRCVIQRKCRNILFQLAKIVVIENVFCM